MITTHHALDATRSRSSLVLQTEMSAIYDNVCLLVCCLVKRWVLCCWACRREGKLNWDLNWLYAASRKRKKMSKHTIFFFFHSTISFKQDCKNFQGATANLVLTQPHTADWDRKTHGSFKAKLSHTHTQTHRRYTEWAWVLPQEKNKTIKRS